MMTIQERIELIKKFPLFTDLSQSELERLAKNAKEKTFKPHVVILSPTHDVDGIYLVYKGLLTTYIITSVGKLIPIRIRGPLYMASERNIVGENRKVTLETIKDTDVLILSKNDCKEIIVENHCNIMFILLKIVIEKLEVVHEQIENYYSVSLKERTMNLLKELAPHYEKNSISLSQEEIANLVGATRARVTEALNELQREKKIVIQYRKIEIISPLTE